MVTIRVGFNWLFVMPLESVPLAFYNFLVIEAGHGAGEGMSTINKIKNFCSFAGQDVILQELLMVFVKTEFGRFLLRESDEGGKFSFAVFPYFLLLIMIVSLLQFECNAKLSRRKRIRFLPLRSPFLRYLSFNNNIIDNIIREL